MIFKNNNVEVSIDTSTGAIVIKHNNGASIEVITDSSIGIKVLGNNIVKQLNYPRHLYALGVLITKD